MIIISNQELRKRYHELKEGDCFVGRLSYKYLQDYALIDLLERNIHCFPSALSQVLSRSKVAQALILKEWMVPHTTIISRRIDLLKAINYYNQHGIKKVITKTDHLHCGHGIHRWDSIEDLFNQIFFRSIDYPFVLQPFIEEFTDIRVIVAGDYWEAYIRENPYNFRKNVSIGGESRAYVLDPVQKRLCKEVMERGKFPFAHIDIICISGGKSYLSEIALNGGLKGARITHERLTRIKNELLNQQVEKVRNIEKRPANGK